MNNQLSDRWFIQNNHTDSQGFISAIMNGVHIQNGSKALFSVRANNRQIITLTDRYYTSIRGVTSEKQFPMRLKKVTNNNESKIHTIHTSLRPYHKFVYLIIITP